MYYRLPFHPLGKFAFVTIVIYPTDIWIAMQYY